ncbi:MAG: hypothetical protein ACL93V_17295 [Candidatus Electrothrix sp. YB6]
MKIKTYSPEIETRMRNFYGSLSEKEERIRKPGGGRKSVLSTAVGLDDAFFAVLKKHTAGSPMDCTIYTVISVISH